ncbi:MAG TPA: hypothetical protein VMY37_22560 [Thermoguttaceae bacterium]|nr:hypothetical protein [Thermoguttaceae bacterium]
MVWTEFSIEFLRDYWEQVATVATLCILLLTSWKARSVWKARDFMTRVNFSLNYVDANKLKIRTLRETEIDRILLGNRHGRRIVLRAARRTTAEQPFLRLPRTDSWLVLNSVLNELSEEFAEGFLAASIGIPTKAATFVFAITCEKHRDVRMNKIRVMIVEKSLLLEIDKFSDVEFERDSHHVRYQTLKMMRELHLAPEDQHAVMEMEIRVPASAV